ncbi:hypothetical protein [Bergeyella zoohelcum]|uniref:Uncharacterized protein n=1 Tax=Bergeyella zoohelcum TaxID=1015 RepID=A0A380ZT79_9FLAO|nr:hypothetical protein [Bergeyella zoohelcum]EKB59086.1 hypothetical protein HMPREF9700_01563 [Bergeyella zoohelcum CCUG 30536]SUV52552.1 Uncharacterised protein [Bergeyella zoohelcum]
MEDAKSCLFTIGLLLFFSVLGGLFLEEIMNYFGYEFTNRILNLVFGLILSVSTIALFFIPYKRIYFELNDEVFKRKEIKTIYLEYINDLEKKIKEHRKNTEYINKVNKKIEQNLNSNNDVFE